MSDHLGIFGPGDDERSDGTGPVDVDELRRALADGAVETAEPTPPPVATRRRAMRARREVLARRRRRRRRQSIVAVAVLLVLAIAITVGIVLWSGRTAPVADFTGDPGAQTIVRVQSGDARADIAATLAQDKVVASAQAFLDATAHDADVAALEPGYYRLQSHLPAKDAVDQLVDPDNKVGHLRVIPGRRLADVTGKNGAVTQGYLSQITAVACVPLDGQSDCWSAKDLLKVAETADPITLGAPDWAVAGINAAPESATRLEGMIVPGDYDVKPNQTAQDTLRDVISQSAALWNSSSIVADSASAGLTPYQTAIIASLVEREGITKDMGKVARVIENRVQQQMPLQLDSTVNYALNRAQISTTVDDRNSASPYNTYLIPGLPPTPISSPSQDAVTATVSPTVGNWLYFVKVQSDGTSCFSESRAEHDACVAQARANGVFDE